MPLALICTTPTLQAITGNSIRVAGFATPVRSIQAGRTPLIDRWSNLTTKAAPESKERFPEGMCKHEEHELVANAQQRDFR